MKDPADTVTQELPLPAKRGRPATGRALSAAERKRAQRMRDRRTMSQAFDDPVKFHAMPLHTLCEALAVYTSEGYASLAGLIMSEIARRASAADLARRASAADLARGVPYALVSVTVTSIDSAV